MRLFVAKNIAAKNDYHAWGWASTTVRATPKEVLAYMWDTLGRSKRRADDLEKSVDERVNDHNMLVYNKKKTPKVSEREGRRSTPTASNNRLGHHR